MGTGRPTNYVGIACTFHDPAIAIVDASGELVFAESAERPLQTKRALGLRVDEPNYISAVIDEYCDPGARLVVAKTWSRRWLAGARLLHGLTSVLDRVAPRPNRWSRRLDLLRLGLGAQIPAASSAAEFIRYVAPYWHQPVSGIGGRVTTRAYDHHLCHAAAAILTSDFPEATCAVVDGYGEDSSAAFYAWSKGRLQRLQEPKSRTASLGWFYTLASIACGFNWLKGEEWKLMGLAAYGRLDPAIHERLGRLIRVDGTRIVAGTGFFTDPVWRATELRGNADFAHTAQAVFQERLIELLNNLHHRHPSPNLAYSGGCALNSSANGLIPERTPFETLHINSAPADDGCAIGAAYLAYHQDRPGEPWRNGHGNPYLGSRIPPAGLERWQRLGGAADRVERVSDAPLRAARLLAEGKVVGWVQGRAEFGPRALGNRSILADPRRPDIKDILNARVKFREEFRPFAPAILDAYGGEYFDNYRTVRYMEQTLRFREGAGAKVPGVVHVDGTGRVQSVRAEWNERFAALVAEFHRLTGIPIVLNTSFNVMGKPIIHSLEDAVSVFHTTGLDALVIDDYMVVKHAR